MLGDSLLVAPVFSSDGILNYYVPEGRWTNLLDRNVVEGPRWVRETHDFKSLPLLVRPNSVIPIGSHTDKPDYDYSNDVTLQVYQFEDGRQASVELPDLNGTIQTRFDIKRERNVIYLERQGATKAWNILLVGIGDVENLENFEIVNGSVLVKLNDEVNKLTLHIGNQTTDKHR